MLDFLMKYKDEIILIIIGVVIGGTINIFAKLTKKGFYKLCEQINMGYKFIKRRIKGDYNLNEFERILEKPKNKLTKRELNAIQKFEEQVNQMNKTTSILYNFVGVKRKN